MDTIETIDPDADPLIGEQPGVGDRQRLEIAPTLRLQLRRARLVIDIPQRVLQIENERGIETSRLAHEARRQPRLSDGYELERSDGHRRRVGQPLTEIPTSVGPAAALACCACSIAASTKPAKSGCGRSGRERNSGWNWLATNHG